MFKIDRVKIDSRNYKCYYECDNKFVFEILKHITTYLKKSRMKLNIIDKLIKVPDHFGIKEVLESGIKLLVIYEQVPIRIIEKFENDIYCKTIKTFNKIIEPRYKEIYINSNKELHYNILIDVYNNEFKSTVEKMLENSKSMI